MNSRCFLLLISTYQVARYFCTWELDTHCARACVGTIHITLPTKLNCHKSRTSGICNILWKQTCFFFHRTGLSNKLKCVARNSQLRVRLSPSLRVCISLDVKIVIWEAENTTGKWFCYKWLIEAVNLTEVQIFLIITLKHSLLCNNQHFKGLDTYILAE